jgi:hypothetical protein
MLLCKSPVIVGEYRTALPLVCLIAQLMDFSKVNLISPLLQHHDQSISSQVRHRLQFAF